ncbi:MAG: NAD(P)/FAD-dependent oxidoreductase [Eubacteriales bacterium]
MQQTFDAIIIGGGVVGCAIARELARYDLKIAVLEKNLDVGYEASGRNSAVLHGGFAYNPGTLKAKFCVEANKEFDEVAAELDFPFARTGKVLVGNTPEDMERLKTTLETGKINGARDLEIIDKTRLKELVPAVNGEFALWSPTSGILDPFLYTVALAENAAENGVTFHFDREVTAISRKDELYHITTPKAEYQTKWVINSAGLGCGKISDMLGLTGYTIKGSKGTYLILDQRTGPLLPMPVYPVPSNTYMGIHVTPTMDGNVTVGPDAELTDDFSDYSVPQTNMDFLAESATPLWPHIHKKDYIRNYSGTLSKWIHADGTINDFHIEARDEAPNTVNLIGIESPGLSAALPIARHAVALLVEREQPKKREDFNPKRKGIVRFAHATHEERAKLIEENPDYGELVCRCEKVTKAELLQAIHNPLGVSCMVGIKYRTRCMMGRCQGGYCQMRMAEMIQTELGIPLEEIAHARQGSNPFTGRMRK